MKKLFPFAVLLVCAAALFAQKPAPAAAPADETGLTPPPSVNTFEGRSVYRIGGEIKAPQVVSAPDPPPLKDFSAGRVVLWCIVGIDGKAHMIKVAKHYTFEADMKAVENLKQWKFKAAKQKSEEVDVLMTVEVVWR
jgi:hypothetical protein